MALLFTKPWAKTGAVLALTMAGILGGGAAQAAGTLSGTDITNLATLKYSVGVGAGAIPQADIGSSPTGNTVGLGSPTSFKVDNKVNLTVATVDSTFVSVIPGITVGTALASQVATFTVTNNGNTVQDFDLSTIVNHANGTTLFGGSDTFNPTACTTKVGAVLSPTYAGATTATYIDELAPDVSRTVYVACTIDAAQSDGEIAVISLTASVLKGGTASSQGAAYTTAEKNALNTDTGIEVVFADVAGTDDIAGDGKSSSRDAFKIVSAKLTVTKTVAPVCDPFNGATNPKNIPGSFVKYTITVTNSGAASAFLTTIEDDLNGKPLTIDPNLILGTTAANCVTGGAATSAVGSGFLVTRTTTGSRAGFPKYYTTISSVDGVDYVSGKVTATLATVLPAEAGYLAGELKTGESISLVFQAQVN